jgi:hypothetical protein
MRNAKPNSEKIPDMNPPRMPRADGTKISSAISVSVIMTIPLLRLPFQDSGHLVDQIDRSLSGSLVSRSQGGAGN